MTQEETDKAFNKFLMGNLAMVPAGVPDLLLKGFFLGGIIAMQEKILERVN